MQAHGIRRTRLQCMVTRTRALHARVTTFSGRMAENRTGTPDNPPAAQPARKVGSTAARQLMAAARWSLR